MTAVPSCPPAFPGRTLHPNAYVGGFTVIQCLIHRDPTGPYLYNLQVGIS